jgi:hypothetical protein
MFVMPLPSPPNSWWLPADIGLGPGAKCTGVTGADQGGGSRPAEAVSGSTAATAAASCGDDAVMPVSCSRQLGKNGWQPTALRAQRSTAAATTDGCELSSTGSSSAQRSRRVVAL